MNDRICYVHGHNKKDGHEQNQNKKKTKKNQNKKMSGVFNLPHKYDPVRDVGLLERLARDAAKNETEKNHAINSARRLRLYIDEARRVARMESQREQEIEDRANDKVAVLAGLLAEEASRLNSMRKELELSVRRESDRALQITTKKILDMEASMIKQIEEHDEKLGNMFMAEDETERRITRIKEELEAHRVNLELYSKINGAFDEKLDELVKHVAGQPVEQPGPGVTITLNFYNGKRVVSPALLCLIGGGFFKGIVWTVLNNNFDGPVPVFDVGFDVIVKSKPKEDSYLHGLEEKHQKRRKNKKEDGLEEEETEVTVYKLLDVHIFDTICFCAMDTRCYGMLNVHEDWKSDLAALGIDVRELCHH